jgi:hypothetical protein
MRIFLCAPTLEIWAHFSSAGTGLQSPACGEDEQQNTPRLFHFPGNSGNVPYVESKLVSSRKWIIRTGGEWTSRQQPELPHRAKLIVELCSLDQPNHSFQAYALSIGEITVAAKGAALASWKETMEYDLYHRQAATQTT